MPRKKADYSQGERWFLLYQYFIKNSNKNSPITFDDICNHLLKYNIEHIQAYCISTVLHTDTGDTPT